MPLRINNNILNQKGTPAFFSDVFANRPAAGFAGRVFISTDTGAIYEDTGSAWTLIADAGAGSSNLQQVTTNGNTTTAGLVVTAGNVAIGTATASAPLDIHGTGTLAQFNGTGTNNAYVFFQNAGTSKWRIGNNYNAGANSFDLYNNNLASIALSVNGVSNTLQVNGNLAIKQGVSFYDIATYNQISSDTGGFFFKLAGSVNNAYLDLSALTAARTFTLPNTGGTLALTSQIPAASQWTTSGSNIYYNTGVVAIGTTTPDASYKLLSKGNVASVDSNGQNTIFLSAGTTVSYIDTSYIGGGSYVPLAFGTSGSEKMRINTVGNVGIGSNSISNGTTFGGGGQSNILKLSSANYPALEINATAGGGGSIQFTYGTNAPNQVGGLIAYNYATGIVKDLVLSQTLSGGTLTAVSYTGGVYLSSGATSWTSSSDERLKNINSNIDNALEKLMTLRTVNFSWKSDETNKENLGLIAQDVEKVFPQVIDKKINNLSKENFEKIEYLGVRYQELVPVLIAAIKELNLKLVRNNIN